MEVFLFFCGFFGTFFILFLFIGSCLTAVPDKQHGKTKKSSFDSVLDDENKKIPSCLDCKHSYDAVLEHKCKRYLYCNLIGVYSDTSCSMTRLLGNCGELGIGFEKNEVDTDKK